MAASGTEHDPPAHLQQDTTSTGRWLGRWVVGASATLLQYPFRRVPLYRRDRTGHDCSPPDPDRALPGDAGTVQRASGGIGPLFHRRYWIELADCAVDGPGLLDAVAGDINRVAPGALSRFEAADGSAARHLDVGDEIVVRLPGPWDGPVRVVGRDDLGLRLVTLDGHVEAGEIAFEVDRTAAGFLRFSIESWARSGQELFHHLYTTVPLAREVQLLMWAQVCRQVAAISGGVVMSNVSAITHEVDEIGRR